MRISSCFPTAVLRCKTVNSSLTIGVKKENLQIELANSQSKITREQNFDLNIEKLEYDWKTTINRTKVNSN